MYISFKEFISEATISSGGVNGEKHKKKYLDPYLNSKELTHVLAVAHSRLEPGSRVRLTKLEWLTVKGKQILHAEAYDGEGNHYLIPVTKLEKPGTVKENKGHIYENKIISILKADGLMREEAQGAGSTAGTDFTIVNKKKNSTHKGRVTSQYGIEELNGETKLNHTAAFGQLTIHYDKTAGGWHISEEARSLRPKYAKSIDESGIIDYLNNNYSDGKMPTTASGRAKSIIFTQDDLSPAEAYLLDHHVDILQVGGGKGAYAVGEDKTGHGFPRITGTGKWTVREKNPGAKLSLTVMFQPNGKYGLKPSHINLENEEDRKALKRTLGHK